MAVFRSFAGLLAFLPVALALIASTPQPVAGQDVDGLGTHGMIRADTAYGRVGEWFALEPLDGDELPFSEFEGRVLFVNFWATWCAPCVKEMPTIADLAESMGGSGVAFLLISIDDDRRLVRRFVKRYTLDELVYLRAWPHGESTFTAGIVPATFIVDRNGTIVYQHHGAANWNTEPIRQFLWRKASE